MRSFDIARDSGSRACVVHLSGDIDVAVVPDLRSALDDTLTSGCTHVVLDLAAVSYADSSALGLLVWLDHRLRPLGGRLVLAGAHRDVTRILELSGLVSIAASISTSENVSAALEGLDLPPTTGDPLWKRELDVPIDVNQLSLIREQVCEILLPLDFPEAGLFDIKVALGEALANAMRHGAPSGDQGQVRIQVAAFDDRVVIEVMDNGSGFDGMPAAGGDLYAPGGRGIMFMRALMDDVEFDRSPMGGTLVRLTKHRAGAA